MRNRLVRLMLLVSVAAYAFVGHSTAFAIERIATAPSTTQKKAPNSNIFQLKGDSNRYILLDATDEGYFVLAEKTVASKTASVNGEPVAFDPEDPNSIAYWLNNDYINDKTVAKRLPQIMIDNLIEREYTTEGGGSQVTFRSDYKSKCKIVILSQTEWSKYNAKFGYADDSGVAYWLLRSVIASTADPMVAYTSGTHAGVTQYGKWTSAAGIRPAFYLSKDFFEKATLDVENTGDAILSMIRTEADYSMLNKMYSATEMYNLTESNLAPTAISVSIKGRGIVGEKIEGKYEYVSMDGNSEDGTAISWEKSIDKKVWSSILGADSKDYIPTENDIGYYVKMRVSPATNEVAGATYESQPLSIAIRPVSTPVASNVRIESNGIVKPGIILEAKYSFYDENRDICTRTNYEWEAVSADGETAEVIGNTRYLKLTNKEAGKLVRVSIVPQKTTKSETNEVVAGEKVYSDWVQVENLPSASEVTIVRDMDLTVSVSKTDDGVSLKGLLHPILNKGIERITAVYSMNASDGCTIVCEWQGADSKDGVYDYITSGTDYLDYAPKYAMWVRAKIYTKNAQNISNAIYSEPVFVGEDNDVQVKGELTLTKDLTAGKTYEIWLSNDTSRNNYAFSFNMTGAFEGELLSDNYIIKQDGNYVIGSKRFGGFNDDYSFKVGEITPQKDATVTISDAMTAKIGNSPASQTRVFIVEK